MSYKKGDIYQRLVTEEEEDEGDERVRFDLRIVEVLPPIVLCAWGIFLWLSLSHHLVGGG